MAAVLQRRCQHYRTTLTRRFLVPSCSSTLLPLPCYDSIPTDDSLPPAKLLLFQLQLSLPPSRASGGSPLMAAGFVRCVCCWLRPGVRGRGSGALALCAKTAVSSLVQSRLCAPTIAPRCWPLLRCENRFFRAKY